MADKRIGIVGGIVVVLAAVVAYRVLTPHQAAQDALVSVGRGVITDVGTVTVIHAGVSPETVDYDGKTVQAGAGHQYVLLDCRIEAPSQDVDFDDFQLVRDRAPLGHEVNVGNHADAGYFYWTYLDASGRPAGQTLATAKAFIARLSFKVPSDVPSAYLFYWGLYWGPFELH
ncbi:MAG TPA: hypothetical protein VLV16_15580 [Gemmatimonadales bacterium]|nr:hypothetical protein [Gemmatimonadales bacterium]